MSRVSASCARAIAVNDPAINSVVASVARMPSLEEQRRELTEILAPVDPRVAAGRLLVRDAEAVTVEHGDCRARRLDQEVVLARREPHELEPAPLRRVVELGAMPVFPLSALADAEDARAED